MTRNNPISRRTALKGLGGTLATVGVGGAALLATTGPAAAATQNYDDVTITSHDGSVDYVAIYGDSTVKWEGLEQEATHFGISIDAEVTEGDFSVISRTNIHNTGIRELLQDWGGDNEESSGHGNSGEINSAIGYDDGTHVPENDWHIIGTDPDDYGLPSDPLDAAELEVGPDGETRSFTVTMYSTYTWYSGDSESDEVYSETFETSFNVTVEDIPQDAGVTSGDGGATGAPNDNQELTATPTETTE